MNRWYLGKKEVIMEKGEGCGHEWAFNSLFDWHVLPEVVDRRIRKSFDLRMGCNLWNMSTVVWQSCLSG